MTSIRDGSISHKPVSRQIRSSALTTEFVRHDLAKNPTGTSEPDRVRVIREGVASYLPDIDPEETAECSTSCWSARDRRGRAI
jgi:pyruvate dehydrogenase E1 component